VLFITWLSVAACKKNINTGDRPASPNPTSSKYELLRKINWSTHGAEAKFAYNNDSTLKTIDYNGSGSGYSVLFSHTDRGIHSVDVGSSLYKYDYIYNEKSQISNVRRLDAFSTDYSQDLAFSYRQDGAIAGLRYYQGIGMARKLVYTHTYGYNASGMLAEISVVGNNGTQFLITLNGYSDTFQFDPLWLLGIDLNENYAIYNYPVLKQMNALPAIIKRFRIGNGKSILEQIITITSTIKNERLEKQHTSIHYPENPALDSSTEAVFEY